MLWNNNDDNNERSTSSTANNNNNNDDSEASTTASTGNQIGDTVRNAFSGFANSSQNPASSTDESSESPLTNAFTPIQSPKTSAFINPDDILINSRNIGNGVIDNARNIYGPFLQGFPTAKDRVDSSLYRAQSVLYDAIDRAKYRIGSSLPSGSGFN